MKNILKIAVVALALSFFQAYGTAVCPSDDELIEARERWSGATIWIIHSINRDGYWVIIVDPRGGGHKKKYIPADCDDFFSYEEFERLRQRAIEQD